MKLNCTAIIREKCRCIDWQSGYWINNHWHGSIGRGISLTTLQSRTIGGRAGTHPEVDMRQMQTTQWIFIGALILHNKIFLYKWHIDNATNREEREISIRGSEGYWIIIRTSSLSCLAMRCSIHMILWISNRDRTIVPIPYRIIIIAIPRHKSY